jgi:hypothetical protein
MIATGSGRRKAEMLPCTFDSSLLCAPPRGADPGGIYHYKSAREG